MAKKVVGRPKTKAAAPTPETERRKVVLTIKATEEWRGWLDRLSKHLWTPTSTIVDHGVIRYAKESGFDEPAPGPGRRAALEGGPTRSSREAIGAKRSMRSADRARGRRVQGIPGGTGTMADAKRPCYTHRLARERERRGEAPFRFRTSLPRCSHVLTLSATRSGPGSRGSGGRSPATSWSGGSMRIAGGGA